MRDKRRCAGLTLLASVLALGGLLFLFPPDLEAQTFSQMFSIPREPATVLLPGQFFELEVSGRKKDIYVKGLDEGATSLEIYEQRSPGAYEHRYRFDVVNGQTLVINFKTGLKLGDEVPVTAIRIKNSEGGTSPIMARIKGYFVSR